MDSANGYSWRDCGKLCGTPLIFREPSSGLVLTQMWKNYLRVRIGDGASAIISNSRGGDEYWKTIMPDNRRHVVSNALPIDEIDSTKAALPQEIKKPEAPIVLYVGRMMEKQKRPKLFLEVRPASGRRKRFLESCAEKVPSGPNWKG